MITSPINDSKLAQTHASRRPGGRLRRSMAGLAVAAMLVSACGSANDTVSSDADVEEQNVETAAPPVDATASDAENADAGDVAVVQQNGPVEVTGAALATFDSTIDDLTVGTAAPVVAGESFDGTPITIGGPTENPTFVVFLAHWCPHCNDEVPELIGLEDAGRLPEGLDVIGVSTAVEPDRDNFPPSEWIDDRGWPWPTMADDEVLSAMAAVGGNSFPFAVVLDTDGNVLARRAGGASADDTVDFLEAALANA